MHLYGQAVGYLRRVWIIVFDERYIPDAHAVGDERIVVAREIRVRGRVFLRFPRERAFHKGDRPRGLVGDYIIPLHVKVGIEPKFLIALLGGGEAALFYLLCAQFIELPLRESEALVFRRLAAYDLQRRAEVAEGNLFNREAIFHLRRGIPLHLVSPSIVELLRGEREHHFLAALGRDAITEIGARRR